MNRSAPIVFAAGLVVGATAHALLTPSYLGSEPAAGSIVVQNAYFPKDGLAAEVLETRLAASSVRRENGLVVGRVLRRVEGPAGAPFLVWEAEYADAASREADVAALADTNFGDVSSHMGTLLDGFSRIVFEVVDE